MPKSVSLVAAADQPPSTPPPFVQVSDGSTAEVCIRQINAHLEYYEKQCTQVALKYGAPTASASGPSSLVDLSVQQIIRSLRDDPTPESLEVVLKNTPPSLLPKVIQDPSLHYSVFRRWGKTHKIKKELVDVDEYVFLNERDMRTRPESEWDRILVTLEDGDGIWPESEIKDGVRALKRKLPPREHYAILGEKIPSELKIQGSSDSFKRRFDRMTDGILEGLNWNNVFVAGGMALSVLSCVDDDSEKQFMNSDIDLYIYGLSPEDGNAKAEEIWNVWSRNVGDKKKMVVRNAKVFTFLSEYPTRRVQVILKMISSPAGVLLNFDLDQCAIGWDGNRVLMLPRCARALETGYTVFTSDLIYGHHLGDRRATQSTRVFKYADKGYGILFLGRLLESSKVDFAGRSHNYSHRRDSEGKKDIVTGKKAVFRIAYLAQDTVHRFFIGPTEATPLTLEDDDYLMSEYQESVNNLKEESYPIIADFAALDGRSNNTGGAPEGRSGLKMFETFMRMVAAWKFECEGKLKLVEDSFEATEYLTGNYDDLPKYEWCKEFDPEPYAKSVEEYNNDIFSLLKETIERATDTQINYYQPIVQRPPERWAGYLTRRIRRMLTAPTFSEVMSKQITIPVWVPARLVSYISTTMEAVRKLHDLPDTDEFSVIIPGHNPRNDPSVHPPNIPTNLPEGYQLYFWVIGNTTAWARLDRRIDEIFEALWALYHSQFTFSHITYSLVPPVPSSPEDTLSDVVARMFRRRPVPSVPSEPGPWPDKREKTLWNNWLAEPPYTVSRIYTETYKSFYEEMFWYTPKEEWYWSEELHTASDNGVWREWTDDKGKKGEEKVDEGIEDKRGEKRRRESTGLEGITLA